MTMNGTWGYKSYDKNYKSPQTLIRNLVDIASKGGNFLLNVGPTAEGEFPPESVDILAKMGEWMKVNGEAIYGTKASPWGLFPWGRCTQKTNGTGTTLYFTVFDWPADGRLVIPGLRNGVTSASILTNKSKIKTSAGKDGSLTVFLPSPMPDPLATVIKIDVKGKIDNKKPE